MKPLKVLYCALRHDPRDPDLASGVDYNFYSSFVREGLEVKVVGPFTVRPPLLERAGKKIYQKLTGKRYLKWDLCSTLISSKGLNAAEREWHPDVVFTIFPPPLVFYSGKAPCVFNTDLSFHAWQAHGAGFGALALKCLEWQERRAVRRSSKVITHSDWCRNLLAQRHKVPAEKIDILPMPSALPDQVIPPPGGLFGRQLSSPIRLLLVGRDYRRKGVDVAIEVTRRLNAIGVTTELTVCGTSGLSHEHVRFVGPFKKKMSGELRQYAQLYENAHFLIHPALFEAAGIVPAEAAAFGVPTITNDVGGLATSVKEGVSGIVLPRHSPAEEYVKVILGFLADPTSYQNLCRTARARYDTELNWSVAGRRAVAILREVVERHKPSRPVAQLASRNA